MLFRIISIDGWFRAEVGQEIERAARTAREQPLGGAGKKSKQIGFRKTMQVDHEIEFAPANIFDNIKHFENRQRLESITQSDAIDFNCLVRITRQVDDFRARLTNCDRQSGVRELFADRAQGRKTHDYVAELTEVDDENVARVEGHFDLFVIPRNSEIPPGSAFRPADLFAISFRTRRVCSPIE